MKNRNRICIIMAAWGIAAILSFKMAIPVLAEQNDQAVIRQLILARTEAMSQFFASETNYMEASAQLRQIESGHLLEEDTTSLLRYFRTDIDEVTDCRITHIQIKESTENMLCANVEIQWNITGLDGPEELKNEYFIICEKDGKKFKIVEFF